MDIENQLISEIKRWKQRLEIRMSNVLEKEIHGMDFIKNIQAYLADTDYFMNKKDLIRAFECVIWAWAWYEIGEEHSLLKHNGKVQKRWRSFKREAYDKYRNAVNSGKVDKGIIPILDGFNRYPEFVTLSSCEGRITVLDVEKFGDKHGSILLGKWHFPVSWEEVYRTLQQCTREGWLRVEGPIFHIAANSLSKAKLLVEMGLNAGFKRTSIIGISSWKAVVEISTTEIMEVPLVKNGSLIVPESYISIVVEQANLKLERSKEKLSRLVKELHHYCNHEKD
jgi:tRNA wybutosine-synthesizing protein 3